VAGINVVLDGRHDPEQVIQAGGDAVRIVLSTQLDQTNILRAYKDRGLYRLGVYDGDSDNEFPNHDEAMAYYSNLYGPYLSAVQVGNEPDLMESPSSWTMSQPMLASLGWQARTHFGERMPLVCAGMASGQPQWLETLDIRWCNYLAVQPYAKDMSTHRRYMRRPPDPPRYAAGRGPARALNDLPDIEPLMREYALYGLPLMITEWGWWGDEVRGEYEVRDVVRWAEQSPLIERFFYFCMDDGMVPPFGLYRADGSPKPAASAFRDESRWVGSGTDPWSVVPTPPTPPEGVGWIGDGLLQALTTQGWIPTSGEHDETLRLVRAGEDMIVWTDEGAQAYRRVS
jgi:hypothetical protein